MTGEASIVAQGLVRRFGEFTAVDDVSFEVERGEIFGYLGANGAGKSTTIRTLIGLLAPTSGDAQVAGHSIREHPERVKASIGYMSQRFSLYLDLSVQHNLEFFGGAYRLSGRALGRRIDALLERTDLAEHRDTITRDLPGGVRQRAALAGALLHGPRLVFLDEPTAGVDPLSRRRFWRLIRELSSEGTTVFVTTHYMDEAEHCHRVGLMVAGRLVALDTPADLKRTHVPGAMYAVEGAGLLEASEALRSVPGVRTVQPFGAGLHVRVDPALRAETLTQTLERAGARVASIAPADPTLEDVFLEVVAPDTPGEAA